MKDAYCTAVAVSRMKLQIYDNIHNTNHSFKIYLKVCVCVIYIPLKRKLSNFPFYIHINIWLTCLKCFSLFRTNLLNNIVLNSPLEFTFLTPFRNEELSQGNQKAHTK